MSAGVGLVVARDDGERGVLEADLEAGGYTQVSFARCTDALDWLDEETPDVALISSNGDPDLRRTLRLLRMRAVDIVLGHAPLPVG